MNNERNYNTNYKNHNNMKNNNNYKNNPNKEDDKDNQLRLQYKGLSNELREISRNLGYIKLYMDGIFKNIKYNPIVSLHNIRNVLEGVLKKAYESETNRKPYGMTIEKIIHDDVFSNTLNVKMAVTITEIKDIANPGSHYIQPEDRKYMKDKKIIYITLEKLKNVLEWSMERYDIIERYEDDGEEDKKENKPQPITNKHVTKTVIQGNMNGNINTGSGSIVINNNSK